MPRAEPNEAGAGDGSEGYAPNMEGVRGRKTNDDRLTTSPRARPSDGTYMQMLRKAGVGEKNPQSE